MRSNPNAPDDRLRLVVNGVSYRNWVSVDIDSDIFTPADAWHISARVPEPQFVGAFREGMHADIYVGEDRQMAGVIDDVEVAVSKQKTTLELTGRDRAAYLVDCEAEAMKVKHHNLQTLIEKLLKPEWGIGRVIVSNEDNRKKLLGKIDRKSRAGKSTKPAIFKSSTPREKTKIDPGQRVWQIIELHTRQQGLHAWLAANGDLIIGKPEYSQEPAFEFRHFAPRSSASAGNNILSGRVLRSMNDRYAEVKVVGQGAGVRAAMFTEKMKPSKVQATAKDPDLVARGINRRLILTDSDMLKARHAQVHADYEQGRRRLNALTIRLVVGGWRQNGRIFTVDTLARVRIEEANIDGIFWITQRRLLGDKTQKRTELTLHEKGVFLA
jgi:prophage tail gpP-like protein